MTGYNYVLVWFSFFFLSFFLSFFSQRIPLESRYELFLASGFTCTQSVAYKERFNFGLVYNHVLYVLFQSSDYLAYIQLHEQQ